MVLGIFWTLFFTPFFRIFWVFLDFFDPPFFKNLSEISFFLYPLAKSPEISQASPLDDATTHRVDELSWGLPQTTAVCEELGASLLRLDIIRFYILFSIHFLNSNIFTLTFKFILHLCIATRIS